jgi:hypothetical protein
MASRKPKKTQFDLVCESLGEFTLPQKAFLKELWEATDETLADAADELCRNITDADRRLQVITAVQDLRRLQRHIATAISSITPPDDAGQPAVAEAVTA